MNSLRLARKDIKSSIKFMQPPQLNNFDIMSSQDKGEGLQEPI